MYIARGPKIEDMEGAREIIKKQRNQARRSYYFMIGIAILSLCVSIYLLVRLKLRPVSFIYLIYGLMPMAMLPFFNQRIRNYEEQLEDIDFQIDLQQFEVSPQERRAEKILRSHNVQLRRYYGLNLSQNVWIFSLGVFCILLGIAITGITMFLVIRVDQEIRAKVITGLLGAIGGILSNYVAAIYLKMHAAAAANLSSFHCRLVETNQMLLGNFFASRIDDPDKRNETLAQLALNISKLKRNEGENAEDK
jgi:hypothetical protein